jgi:hypothetical protein
MHTAVKPRKIGDMTVDELRSVIRDTMQRHQIYLQGR